MNALKDQPTTNLVPLPECPMTASPVPSLTSIHATPGRGDYGNPGYRGNCSGLLIRDLLTFYGSRRVLDPMEDGGTCRGVLAAPEIIRFGHGSTSSKRIDSTSFIPRLHDGCLVLESGLRDGRPSEVSLAGRIR